MPTPARRLRRNSRRANRQSEPVCPIIPYTLILLLIPCLVLLIRDTILK